MTTPPLHASILKQITIDSRITAIRKQARRGAIVVHRTDPLLCTPTSYLDFKLSNVLLQLSHGSYAISFPQSHSHDFFLVLCSKQDTATNQLSSKSSIFRFYKILRCINYT